MNFLFTFLAASDLMIIDKVGLVLAIMMLACGFFWSTRGIWCWYMKSNEILLRLEKIEKQLKGN